jgi:hypothetical protein
MALVPGRFGRLRRVAIVVVVALCVALGLDPTPASAREGPIGFQASGGWYTEHDAAFLGAGLSVGLATVTVIPNLEWEFVENNWTYSLNVDGTMKVLPLGVGSGYLGAGIGWWRADPRHGSSQTDTVFNLLAGFGLHAVPFKPFAQLKYVVANGDDPVVFSVGVRF